MPVPKDHRDVTVVVQPPASSASVEYNLAFVRVTDAKVLEQLVLDTDNADTSYRQLRVFEHGRLVLDVRTRLHFEHEVSRQQVANKVVNAHGQPVPPVANGQPAHPSALADRHRWSNAVMSVELVVEAFAGNAAATVALYPKGNDQWGLTVARASDNATLASGRLALPAGLVRR